MNDTLRGKAALLAALASVGGGAGVVPERLPSRRGPAPGRYHKDHPSDPELAERVKAKAQQRREQRAAKRLERKG